MDIVTCFINSTHYHECIKSLNNISKEDSKYKFERITNIFDYSEPILFIWTIKDVKDYALLLADNLLNNIYHTILIIEKLPSSDKERDLIDRLHGDKRYSIYYNELNNKEFYNEELFKSIIDKLLSESENLIRYKHIKYFG